MNGFGLYRIYQPLHLHFTTTSYDIFKYAGKTKSITEETFVKRKDCHMFEKWAHKLNNPTKAGQVILSNFIYNDSQFIYGDVEDAISIYNEWKKVRESVSEVFKNECIELAEIKNKLSGFRALFDRTPKGNNAPILQLYQHKRIHPESLVILSSVSHNFIDQWSDEYAIDPLLSDQIFTLRKYIPFVKFDVDKVSKIFKEFLSSNEHK